MSRSRGVSSSRRCARLASAVILVTAAVLMSGCSSTSVSRTFTSTPAPANVAADLKPFYEQRVTWSSCTHTMTCATIEAPLDWSHPSSGSIHLALIRQAAKGHKIGSLLVNPGGPGGSGVDFIKNNVDYATSSTLQKNFDIIGFDPRGVGESSAVKCYDAHDMDNFLYGITPGAIGSDQALAAATVAARNFGAACEKNTGALLAHVDTVSAARDLDLIRAVLGDKKLYYLGYSYGTYLGTVYSSLYPKNTGRLVLDGAIDPAASSFDITRMQSIGFEDSLRSYMASCLSQKGCPFHGSVDDGMNQVAALLSALNLHPLKNDDGRLLGAETMVTAIIFPLYQASAWSYLTGMFQSVMNGSAGEAFDFADQYNDRNSDGTYSDNSTEAFTAINCLDYTYNADPTSMRQQAAVLAQVAPVIGPYMAYGDISCAQWPYTSTVKRGPISAAGSAPILVVGTTHDPATPYVWAQSLAHQLQNGHLLTYRGEGHTAYNKSNECVNTAVDSYLVKGIVPATGKTC